MSPVVLTLSLAVALTSGGFIVGYLAGSLARRDADAIDHRLEGAPSCRWRPSR